jgi:predicted esterase
MNRAWILLVFAFLASCGSSPTVPRGNLLQDVTFNEESPLSTSVEVSRRLMSRSAFAGMQTRLAAEGKALRPYAMKLGDEKFIVYVPATPPPYGLMVFVPPWNGAKLSQGWETVFEQFGMIYVSAENSGNDAHVLERRIPLAIHAAYNLLKRYNIDKERVFVSGFSGGSRVALKLALGYPDLFTGAILNAGSDAIDDNNLSLPPEPLLHLFQRRSHLVYLTGERDNVNLALDRASLISMAKACQFSTEVQEMPLVGHQLAGANALREAISTLLQPHQSDMNRLDQCRNGA